MPLEKSLNVSPYYDDFNEEKDFYRILFKPGVAVQTRELNQLQALLQNQVERFGSHVFKSGTILSGVNFNYLTAYPYAKILDVQTDGQPSLPEGYVNYFVKTSLNLTARVVDYKDGLEASNPDLKTIYLRYTNSSDPDTDAANAVYTVFQPNEQLTVFDEDYPLFKINVISGGVGFSNSDTIVIQSALQLANVTGTFTNGEVITQSTTNAHGIIKAINTTAVANTTILSIAPLTADLTNISVNSAAWTFTTPYTIVGNTSGATANVVGLIGSGATALLTTDTSGIVQSVSLSDVGEDYTFLPWVTVKTSNATATVASLDLVAQNYKAKITVANTTVNAVGTGYAFGVSEGIIYQKGHFLRVEKQSIIIDKYTTTPNNIVVGFKTTEGYVDSNEDETLLDNASGAPNYTAPGADRLLLTPVLTTLTSEQAAANIDFFALAEWKSGLPFKENRTTVYTTIGDELARRTYETHGNYIIDRFNVTTKEKATTNTTHIDVVIDPGTAYIEGYRIATKYNNYINVARSSTTTDLSSQSITVNYGNYTIVKELVGVFDFKAGASVSLYDTAKQLITNSTNTTLTVTSGTITPAGNSIGTARLRSLVLDTGDPGTAEATYRMYLFDIDMDSGYSFRDVKSIYSDSGQDGIADVVRVQDATINANVAQLYDVSRNQLVFPIQAGAVESLENISYIYRTVANNKPIAVTGQLTLGPLNTGFTFPYSGTLSATQEKDFVVIPIVPFQAAANITGTSISVYANGLINGTSTTFISDLTPGDFIKCVEGSNTAYFQIKSIANNTQAQLTTAATAMTAGTTYLYFPALYPISLSRTSRSISINGSADTATINLGVSANVEANAIVVYNVKTSNASPVSKTIERNVLVKIHTANNDGSNTGPWSLGLPGVVRLKNVYLGNSTVVDTTMSDVTKYFVVDPVEDENAYRLSQLKLKNVPSTLAINTNQFILAKVDVLTQASRGLVAIGSYDIDDTANLASSASTINTLEIPELYTTQGKYIDLRNAFDFRPYGTNTAAVTANLSLANTNPSGAFALSSAELYIPAPDSTITFDATYYNKRKDRVVVTSNGSFVVLQGTPDLNNPKAPEQPDHSVTIGVLSVPAYPSLPSILNSQTTEFAGRELASQDTLLTERLSSSLVTVDSIKNINDAQHRVYTMKDIGLLDRRVNTIETTVSLSAIEQKIKELTIPSSITITTNRFKNAFFVDQFSDYTKSDSTHREFRAGISPERGVLQPKINQLNIESEFDLTHSNTAACVTNGFAMLPYTTETLINQNIKNIVLNGDGQEVRFIGSGSVSPPSFSVRLRGERIVEEEAPPPPPPPPSRPWWKFW